MVVDPLRLVYTDISNEPILLSLLTNCMLDNYDTLYLEGPKSLQYPFVMMGEKLVLSVHKRDHNSTVVVMYDPYSGMILAF
jgi:hypothetical protein